jgi:hypothetical protein
MKISEKIINKINKRIETELNKDSFFIFCKKENPEKYKEEFEKRVSKEIQYIKESRIGKKLNINLVKLNCYMDEVNPDIKDNWTRKFIATQRILKEKKNVNKSNKRRSHFC